MAEAAIIPDEAEVRARWGAFAWREKNVRKAHELLGRYPVGRDQSTSIPLLDLAQNQVGAETRTQGCLPVPAVEFVARQIGQPQAMDFVSRGHMPADTTAILGAMDIVFWECDR